MKRRIFLLNLLFLLVGCAAPANPALPAAESEATTTPLPQPAESATVIPDPVECKSKAVIAPTLPAKIPGYTELDESTGLHYTGKYQMIDPTGYRLKVYGKVDHELSLSLDDLRCMPKISEKPVLICQGNFEDITTWAGVPLIHVLNLAGLQKGSKAMRARGADGVEGFLNIQDALQEDNFLAYQWKDEPLPILHGFPVRAVIPSMRGYAWVKWLLEIKVE